MKLFELLDKQVVLQNAQFAYNSIVQDYRTYQRGDYASFVVASMFENNPNGTLSIPRVNKVWGVESYEELQDVLRDEADELDTSVEIDEFPGYDDWWFAFDFGTQGDLFLVLYLGMPEWGYHYAEESASDIEFVPFISDFRRVFGGGQLDHIDELSSDTIILFDERGHETMVTREDKLPFHFRERDYFHRLVVDTKARTPI